VERAGEDQGAEDVDADRDRPPLAGSTKGGYDPAVRLTLILGILLALSAPLSAFGSSQTASPSARLAAMRTAAQSQRSVHYVSVSSAPNQHLRIVADVGVRDGIQRITVKDHGTKGSASAIVSGRKVYIRGDAFSMQVYFGFTSLQATDWADTWISVPRSHPSYGTLSADVTLPSFVSHLFPKVTKLSLVTSGNLIGVQGQAGKGSTTVFAPAQGKPLPVKAIAKTSGAQGTGALTMSRWNVAVNVKAPPHAVPISRVIIG
jgi:hypothetical protein